MKKNKMMRAASALLVLVLLTTSIISGTFAKYVTTDDISDSARVAMFGVEISANGSLFEKNYMQQSSGNTPGSANLTVASSTTANVVAPGTKNEDGLVFSVTGTPEVSVNVVMTVEENSASDIWLGQGLSLPNMTNGAVFNAKTEGWQNRVNDVTFSNTSAYYPIKYTLWHSSTGNNDYQKVSNCDGVPLYTIVAELKSLSQGESTTYGPNTNLAQEFGYYKLTWEWPFENNVGGVTPDSDKQDTLLGDLAADKYTTGSPSIVQKALTALGTASDGSVQTQLKETTTEGNKTVAQGASSNVYYYNLDAALKITITVTQVD